MKGAEMIPDFDRQPTAIQTAGRVPAPRPRQEQQIAESELGLRMIAIGGPSTNQRDE